jgi:hypothetical protein
MEKQRVRVIIRNFIIELIVYGILLVAYFFVVLRSLSTLLTRYFETNLVIYAFVGLGLIVAQGVLLDAITSAIIGQIKLERTE